MLETNENRLVEILLQCQPGQPRTRGTWEVDHQGTLLILPSIGGITLNLQVGDLAFGWEGDHIEPGVSCTADTHKPYEHPNVTVQMLSCVGNTATTSPAKPKARLVWCLATTAARSTSLLIFRVRLRRRCSMATPLWLGRVVRG